MSLFFKPDRKIKKAERFHANFLRLQGCCSEEYVLFRINSVLSIEIFFIFIDMINEGGSSHSTFIVI